MRFETTGSCGGTLLTNPCFFKVSKDGRQVQEAVFGELMVDSHGFVPIYRISLHSVMAGLWVKLVSRKLGWFILKATRNVGPLGHSTEFSSCMKPKKAHPQRRKKRKKDGRTQMQPPRGSRMQGAQRWLYRSLPRKRFDMCALFVKGL